MASDAALPWLVLIHQLPATPSNLRVKVWRRLQALGAVSLKNSVYVLPNTDAAREDLEWVLREIRTEGGEASLCEARLVDGLDDHTLRTLFTEAREADYRALATEVRRLAHDTLAGGVRRLSDEARTKGLAALARLRQRFDAIVAIDFFGAPGREAVHGLVVGLERKLSPASPPTTRSAVATFALADVQERTWVTRTGVHIDRIGSAWLIRRFIDPRARFKFVAARGYVPTPRELRFDMFDAEFTHDGDLCTFEVLARAFAVSDPALHAVAEIVHDIDLKEARFGHEETAGIEHLVAGLAWAHADDDARLEHGGVLFDALYAYFTQRKRKARP